MLDFATRARSFDTEEKARAFIIENQCDPDQNNLVRAGVGWVVVDDTPRPHLWKSHKPAKDEAHAAANAALEQLAELQRQFSEHVTQTIALIGGLTDELATVRASVREAGDLTDTVAGLSARMDALEYAGDHPTPSEDGGA